VHVQEIIITKYRPGGRYAPTRWTWPCNRISICIGAQKPRRFDGANCKTGADFDGCRGDQHQHNFQHGCTSAEAPTESTPASL